MRDVLSSGGILDWAQGLDAYCSDSHGIGGLVVHEDGSYTVSGNFEDSMVFAPDGPLETEIVSAGGFDSFVAKFAVDHSLVWVRQGAGSGYVNARLTTTLPDGSSIVTGRFGSSWPPDDVTFGLGEDNETTLTCASGGSDMYLMRLAP